MKKSTVFHRILDKIRKNQSLEPTNVHSQDPPISLLRSYFENFTIHGLSKVFTGKLWEKVLWFIVLLASMIFVSNASLGFIEQYRAFDTFTDIKIQSLSEITLPAVSICEQHQWRIACYDNKSILGLDSCDHPVTEDLPTGNKIYDILNPNQQRYVALHPVYST